MNIVLLGHDDSPSLLAMSLLVTSRPDHDYTLFVSGALEQKRAPAPLDRLAAVDRALCERWLELPDVPVAVRGGRPLPDPNSPGGLEALRATAPDLVVSIRYRRILRDAAIAVAPHGVLNLHSGLLPDYQGVMATFWALLAGEPVIGCTLHRIVDAGIDTGPVLGVATRPAERRTSYLANVLALYPAGIAMVTEAMDTIAAGREPPATRQSPGAGRYYSTPDKAALDRFDRAGLALTDGSETALLEKQSKALSFTRNP